MRWSLARDALPGRPGPTSVHRRRPHAPHCGPPGHTITPATNIGGVSCCSPLTALAEIQRTAERIVSTTTASTTAWVAHAIILHPLSLLLLCWCRSCCFVSILLLLHVCRLCSGAIILNERSLRSLRPK